MTGMTNVAKVAETSSNFSEKPIEKLSDRNQILVCKRTVSSLNLCKFLAIWTLHADMNK